MLGLFQLREASVGLGRVARVASPRSALGYGEKFGLCSSQLVVVVEGLGMVWLLLCLILVYIS